MVEIPDYILDRINEAKEKHLPQLSLRYAELVAIPEMVFNLSRLEVLDLSGNSLQKVPDSVSKLKNLKEIYLNGNKLREIPFALFNLDALATLDVSDNLLDKIPEELSQLLFLSHLDISENHIDRIPHFINKIKSLVELNLSSNNFSSLPKAMISLKKLCKLNLSNNLLGELPEWIGEMPQLKVLELSATHIQEIPSSLTNHECLEVLDVSHNQIEDFPVVICSMPFLNQLDLSFNQISKIPESIQQLDKLTQINLDNNRFQRFPISICELSLLSRLYLRSNQLQNLPKSILKLGNLTQFYISNNKLTKLPSFITQMSKLNKLDTRNNPISNIPIEIFQRGVGAIRSYFQQLNDVGGSELYEAKLLIVGEGGSGKTTLLEKLQNPQYELKEEDPTRGIDISDMLIEIPDSEKNAKKKIRLNIWDFGGQEIYHYTHQFFLTKRSLYILMTDTREDKTDFDFWLHTIELLSEGSPVLIISNEKSEIKKTNLGKKKLQKKFANIKGFFMTNLATNRGLSEIIENVKWHTQQLPHIGNKVPQTWSEVRNNLDTDTRNFISLEEYLEICKECGIDDNQNPDTSSGKTLALHLSEYLHDIGVFLHYQENLILKKIIILNPSWVTHGVYKVLDDPVIQKNLGSFASGDLIRIWEGSDYHSSQDELIELMQQFNLCYKLKHQNTFIIPKLLPEESPNYKWNSESNIVMKLHYQKFMPKGLLSRFIVQTHRYIYRSQVWLDGVILERENTRAEITSDYDLKHITIRVEGERRSDLLEIIRYEFEKIHILFKPGLKMKSIIPCGCNREKPYEFEYEDLVNMVEKMGFSKEKCYRCGETLDFESMLDRISKRTIYNKEISRVQIEDINKNLGKGQIKEAIDKIMKLTEISHREYFNTAIITSSRYNNLKNNLQLLDKEYIIRERNQIVKSLLDLLNDLLEP